MIDVLRGKYRIVREIARSNDIVYEATDTALGRRVALKELNVPANLTGQARRERVERFTREARAAGRLSHPNIVSIYDFGEENGRHFIAMEYLEGQNLRDLLAVRGTFPLKEALDIACQVLDALAYAHNNRVIHRDIKPDNIQILPGGQVKITDFGIARLTEEPSLTSNGQVFGTPSYMSPEQIEGRSIDHRSDIFSAGIVLYEMLAGRKPFTGDSVVSITYAIMNAEPPALNGVPTGIEQVIRRALGKRPEQRQVSAEQMKLDLRNAEQTPPVFFSPSTGMTGQTGMGYGTPQAGMGTPAPYGSYTNQQMPGYSPPINTPQPGYGPQTGYQMPPNIPPVPQQGGQMPGLPWAWNGAANPQPAPAVQPGLPGMGGVQPYASPPFPARPPEPLFVLTPPMKKFLISVTAAIILGGGTALGVKWVYDSYDMYTRTAGAQRIAILIGQGVKAYNERNYREARDLFEQARNANPMPKERFTIEYNLTATYIQMALQAKSDSRLAEAKDLFEKALKITPDSRAALLGLADLLEKQGNREEARKHRAAAQNSPQDEDRTPAALSTDGSQDTQRFIAERQQEARRLIDEGKTLATQGDAEGARAKWREAIGKAPGTPERDEAQQLLDQTEPSGSFGG